MSSPAFSAPVDPAADDSTDPLALPLPPDTVLLEGGQAPADGEPEALAGLQLALRAVRQQIQELGLDLPLRETVASVVASAPAGASVEPADDARLVQLGRLRVLLVCAPFWAETLVVPTAPWRQPGRLPHLLLGACVEAECGAVRLPGVLTAAELHGLCPGFADSTAARSLPTAALRGGLDRLFLLARLMDPEALLPLQPAPVRLSDWLDGVLAEALCALGGELLPAAAGAFRSGAFPADQPAARATVAIPLALVAGRIEAGAASAAASERFRLLLQLCGAESGPAWLELRLEPELAGDLLPEGLRLGAGGRWVDSGDGGSGPLTLRVPAGQEEIAIELQMGSGPPIRLPSLRFGPQGDGEPGPAA